MNKKIMTFMLIAVVVSGIFLSGCEPQTIIADDSGATAAGVSGVVDANNKFAFELYSELKDKEDNVFFSPYSISTALAMTYEGARGQTAEEMQSVFHFPEDDNIRRPAFARVYNLLNKPEKEYLLSTANALWAQEDFKFLDSYLNAVEKYYGGKTTNLDFRTETEKSRKIINSWVEKQTNDKIKDLIPQGILSPATRLVLTNAIYFKGKWVEQFDEDSTRDADFRVSPDNIVKVPMMRNTEDFNYAETDDLLILEMLYEGEELSMIILLPKEDLASLEQSLTAEKLAEWKNLLSKERVSVQIPRFKFETKYYMKDTLMDMGMPVAFSENADFSGMTGKRDLFISNVIHQTFVEVNEEGTEAAAATAVAMVESAAPSEIKIFRADHPFIFLIQERETGNILFLGKISDPSKL